MKINLSTISYSIFLLFIFSLFVGFLNQEAISGAGAKKDFYFTWNYDKKPNRFSKDATVEYVDASKFDKQLLIRSIDKNDKFTPLGMRGTKKVNDYLSDQKKSSILKSDILAICNNNDIVWVAGERINNKYRITKDSKIVAKLNFLRK